MKIAILMSTYNGHKYLNEQMESLANQTLKDSMTIYVRDDGSSDDTIEIIEKWSKRIDIVLYKGKNVGPAKSFWELFMNPEIQADYYALCDQDDVWDEDKIQKGIFAIKKYENEPMLWCTNCRLIDGMGEIIRKKMNIEKLDFTIASQLVCGTTQGCAMLFNDSLRRYIFGKSPKIFPMHDFVIITYAIAVGKVVYDEEPSFSYRVHGNNVVAKNEKSVTKRIKCSMKIWFSNEHRGELSRFSEVLLKDNEKYIDKTTSDYIKNLVRSKKNIFLRFKIIFDPLTKTSNKAALLSFRKRCFLGII